MADSQFCHPLVEFVGHPIRIGNFDGCILIISLDEELSCATNHLVALDYESGEIGSSFEVFVYCVSVYPR